jgi:preprotein translocase subunit SecE
MGKIFGFFREVYGEMQKVVWPSRTQTIMYTVQVIVFSLAVALILGAADYGLLVLFEKIVVK